MAHQAAGEEGKPHGEIRGKADREALSIIGHLASENNTECFSYEELPDGTLRITGYSEEKSTQNPYQVTIPSMIDGKQVSTIGKGCLGIPDSA